MSKVFLSSVMSMRSCFLFVLIACFFTVPVFSDWTEPVPVTVANNFLGEEWSPFLAFDGLTLYFSRVISTKSYSGKIYIATREKAAGPFTSVKMLAGSLNNSSGHQLCPWVSCDNLRMYYHNELSGRYRLMLSERVSIDAPWPAGRNIEELNALGDKLQAPSLTQDELIVVFDAYKFPGGKGGYDVWMAMRPDRHSAFTKYRNLSEINSEFDENRTSISPDGYELYFDSNRNGKPQIFNATRKSLDEPFGNVEHFSKFDVPGNISSQAFISYNGRELYFRRESVSNRSTRDIYVSYFTDNSFYLDSSDRGDLNSGSGSQEAFTTIQKGVSENE